MATKYAIVMYGKQATVSYKAGIPFFKKEITERWASANGYHWINAETGERCEMVNVHLDRLLCLNYRINRGDGNAEQSD